MKRRGYAFVLSLALLLAGLFTVARPANALEQHLFCQYDVVSTTVSSITLPNDCSGSAWNTGGYYTMRLVMMASALYDYPTCATATSIAMRFNNDSSTIYSQSSIGTTITQDRLQLTWIPCTQSAGVVSTSEILIPIATTSLFHKTASWRGAEYGIGTGGFTRVDAGLWRSTAPITSVTIFSETGKYFRQWSRIDLFVE
jgi:hypothetical protein